jgi:hypothetical protein
VTERGRTSLKRRRAREEELQERNGDEEPAADAGHRIRRGAAARREKMSEKRRAICDRRGRGHAVVDDPRPFNEALEHLLKSLETKPPGE